MPDIPLEALGLQKKWAKLYKLQEEVKDLTQRHQLAVTEVRALEQQLETARSADLDREAKALRVGKDAPKPTHEPKVQSKLETAKRNELVYSRAVQEAESDLGAYLADNKHALYRAVLEARNEIAREVGKHAQAAAVGFGKWSDLHYTLKDLTPPVVHDENAPAAPGAIVLGVHTTKSSGPPRGNVEAMLAYLASLAPPEEEGTDAA